MKPIAVLASYVCIAHAVLAAASAREAGPAPRADDLDEESDSAAFTVVVEHGDGRRCGGALVSLRTALTSARCARLPAAAAAAELWARATAPGASPAAARVVRVALAAGADLDAEEAWSARAASRDVALLELATALGGARSILLASSRADCAEAACYLVRALSGRPRPRPLLRIVELSAAPTRACWAGAPAAPEERALCLDGPELCQSERGAGVVCGGKLCGVLSGSRGGGCGAPHAAASVPRWRRFLHCAHTRRACGRDGECARLCTERWLVEEPEDVAPPPAPPRPLAPPAPPSAPPAPDDDFVPPARTTLLEESDSVALSAPAAPPPTRSPAAPPAPPPPPPLQLDSASTARFAFEFEPNRADFTAGEYGDSAADYVPPEEPAPAPAAAPPPPPTAARPPPPPASRRGALLARVSPAPASALAAPPPLLTTALYLCSFIFYAF